MLDVFLSEAVLRNVINVAVFDVIHVLREDPAESNQVIARPRLIRGYHLIPLTV